MSTDAPNADAMAARKKRRRRALILLVVIAIAVWWFFFRAPKPAAQPVVPAPAAAPAN
jgi:hypothetical protein